MTRSLLSLFLFAGLLGCAQSGKKSETPSEAKAKPEAKAEAKIVETKAAPSDAKATSKAAKSNKGKDMKAAKAEAQSEAPSAKAAASSEGGATVTCESGADKRTITVKSVDRGCEVIYDKNGTSTTPGTGKSGAENCNRIQDKIKTNLVNAGFKCN